MIETNSDLLKGISIGIFLSLMSLITTIGNLIVILAFSNDHKLRTINDYLILNMSIADLFVGLICIPLYIPFSIKNIWPFGKMFCQIWVTIDDVSTMASVINIVAITINRYWLIAHPISYRKSIQRKFVFRVMGAIWIISFLNFGPGIWLMNLFEDIKYDAKNCLGDYNRSFIYMLIAQFNYFVIPFILLCLFNLLIIFNIWKRTKRNFRFKSIQFQSNETTISIRKSAIQNESSPIVQSRRSTSQQIRFSRNANSSKEDSPCHSNRHLIKLDENFKRPKLNDLRIKRDRKAARSLFILVFVFIIFLFPYVICATATAAGFFIPKFVFQFSFYLLWMNSTFNPFLYPFIQHKYRNAYHQLFKSFFNK